MSRFSTKKLPTLQYSMEPNRHVGSDNCLGRVKVQLSPSSSGRDSFIVTAFFDNIKDPTQARDQKIS